MFRKLRLALLSFILTSLVAACALTTTSLILMDKSVSAASSPLPAFSWGSNAWSQLGHGYMPDNNTPLPVYSAFGFDTFTAISAGGYHSLGLASNGKLYSWGDNMWGQLGNGDNVNAAGPTQVNLPAGVSDGFSYTAISAGGTHSLGLGNNGKLYSWGDNAYGELGVESNITYKYIPLAVSMPVGVSGFKLFSAGSNYSLGLGSDGKLYSWGRNNYGQLGDGTAANKPTPVAARLPAGVSSDLTFIALSAGGNHSLALGNNGKLYSWGRNEYGQLGDGTNFERRIPVAVKLPDGVSSDFAFTAISAGDTHSLALGNDGKLYSWGCNEDGQLGDGTKTNRRTPVAVNLPFGVNSFTALSAGGNYNLGLGNNGKLYSWGRNIEEELGDGTHINRLSPVAVRNLVSVTDFDAGGGHSLVLGVVPNLTVSEPVPTFEGNSGITSLSFTFSLDTPSTEYVTVDYTTYDNTAISPDDYAATSGKLIFPPGTTRQIIVVPVVGDTTIEPDESFQFVVNNATGAVLVTLWLSPIILNDDVPAGKSALSLTSSVNPSHLNEAVTFTAKVAPATATGTILLKEGATAIAGGILSGGQVSFTFTNLSAGEHTIIAEYSGDNAVSGSISSPLLQVVQTKKKVKELLPANLIAKLRVTPDRFFSVTKKDEILAYTLSIKNVGPGKAGMVYVVFPIAEGLEAAYTQFSRADIWVEKVAPVGEGVAQAYVQIHYPTLESGMETEVKLYFRVKAGASLPDGTSFLTRYWVNWNDELVPVNKRMSNAVRLSFTTRAESLSLSGGEVQTFLAPEGTQLSKGGKLKLAGDFYLPDELVTFWYTDKAKQSRELAKARADANGNISFDLEAGMFKASEEYVVAGYGNTSGIYGSAVIQLTNQSQSVGAASSSLLAPQYSYQLKPFNLVDWQQYFGATQPK